MVVPQAVPQVQVDEQGPREDALRALALAVAYGPGFCSAADLERWGAMTEEERMKAQSLAHIANVLP
jgi:hypothetical protein